MQKYPTQKGHGIQPTKMSLVRTKMSIQYSTYNPTQHTAETLVITRKASSSRLDALQVMSKSYLGCISSYVYIYKGKNNSSHQKRIISIYNIACFLPSSLRSFPPSFLSFLYPMTSCHIVLSDTDKEIKLGNTKVKKQSTYLMAIICLSYIGATLYRILFFAVVGSRCVCRILPDLSCLDKRRMWNQDCLPKLSPRHPAALQMVSMVTFSTQASAAGSLLSFLSHFPSLSKSARQGAKISISLGWESIMAFTVETSCLCRHFTLLGGFSSLQTGVRFWLKGTFPIDVDVTNDSHKWDV